MEKQKEIEEISYENRRVGDGEGYEEGKGKGHVNKNIREEERGGYNKNGKGSNEKDFSIKSLYEALVKKDSTGYQLSINVTSQLKIWHTKALSKFSFYFRQPFKVQLSHKIC